MGCQRNNWSILWMCNINSGPWLFGLDLYARLTTFCLKYFCCKTRSIENRMVQFKKNLTEYSKEGYGSNKTVLPMMMTKIMNDIWFRRLGDEHKFNGVWEEAEENIWDKGEDIRVVGENCVYCSLIIYVSYRIMLWWLNQRAWDVSDT
jgi:hypothetical protein